MASFDVTSLFKSIPQELAEDTIKRIMEQTSYEDQTRLTTANMMQLLNIYLQSFFHWTGRYMSRSKKHQWMHRSPE